MDEGMSKCKALHNRRFLECNKKIKMSALKWSI